MTRRSQRLRPTRDGYPGPPEVHQRYYPAGPSRPEEGGPLEIDGTRPAGLAVGRRGRLGRRVTGRKDGTYGRRDGRRGPGVPSRGVSCYPGGISLLLPGWYISLLLPGCISLLLPGCICPSMLPGCICPSMLPGCISLLLPGCYSLLLPGCYSLLLPGCYSLLLPGWSPSWWSRGHRSALEGLLIKSLKAAPHGTSKVPLLLLLCTFDEMILGGFPVCGLRGPLRKC